MIVPGLFSSAESSSKYDPVYRGEVENEPKPICFRMYRIALAELTL